MKALYFSSAADAAGCREESLPGPLPATEEEFWVFLIQLHPNLEKLQATCRLAIDGQYVEPGNFPAAAVGAREIAILPPVSGG